MANKHLPKKGSADFGTVEHYYFEIERKMEPTIFNCIESAIVARIDGDWDNPDLLDYGDLNVSEKADIEKIISTAPLEETDKYKLRVKYLAN
jgi:hypothetical protein